MRQKRRGVNRAWILLALYFWTGLVFGQQDDTFDRAGVTPVEAAAMAGEVIFVDVRSSFEYLFGHLEGAVHIPHGDILTTIQTALPDKSKPLVTYCSAGVRASSVVAGLRQLGYRVVPVTPGGYAELVRAGLKSD